MKKKTNLSHAATLSEDEKKVLALKIIQKKETLKKIARDNSISRKFLYKQKEKVESAIDKAFSEEEKNDKVLFYIPVTKEWIKQVVLSLVLIAHCSLRSASEFLKATMDYSISHSTVDNIVKESILSARKINEEEKLEKIKHGALDEIYQAGKPVLAGLDLESTYCFLLNAEEHCDETTWGFHLLEATKRGLNMEYTVADGGKGLRAGQKAAFENTPCHGDVFHAERDLGKLVTYLENRAKRCKAVRVSLEGKMKRAKKKAEGQKFSRKLTIASKEEVSSASLARDIRILSSWVRNDILSLSGASYSDRKELYDFIVEELCVREKESPYRIKPIRRLFENSREQLLAFVGILDEKLGDLSVRFNTPVYLIQKVCELQGLNQDSNFYWEKRSDLFRILRNKYHKIEEAVNEAMSQVHRASSLVENLNSRLRNYFFLRRHVGNEYLNLLRFFLNHRTFIRSDRPERVGKSPAQLLSGSEHPHWLELLGFKLFKRETKTSAGKAVA
jgi:hypothetical protein